MTEDIEARKEEPSIKKAIEITELEKDLAQLTAQAQRVSGVIQYIQGKIKQLKKPEG